MMHAMNDNEKKVLKLPYEINIGDDSRSDDEIVYQTKLAWVQPINLAIIGVRKLTEDDKRAIWGVNALCIKYGYAPLEVDLDNL